MSRRHAIAGACRNALHRAGDLGVDRGLLQADEAHRFDEHQRVKQLPDQVEQRCRYQQHDQVPAPAGNRPFGRRVRDPDAVLAVRGDALGWTKSDFHGFSVSR